MAASTWPIIRETVNVPKSGSLRSGHEVGTPHSRSRSPNQRALPDEGDEANPCR